MVDKEEVKITQLIGYFFIINGVFFFLVTAIGMVRFKDFYIKLHIGSKCLTGGGISILLGIIIFKGFSLFSLKLGLIIIFLIITNPVTTHAIGRAGYYYCKDQNNKWTNLVRDDLTERKSEGLE